MSLIKALAVSVMLAFSSLTWAGPINVNTADEAMLAEELVGVGEKLAAVIVQVRESGGPFKDGPDLIARVKGLGEKFLEKNKENLLFSTPQKKK